MLFIRFNSRVESNVGCLAFLEIRSSFHPHLYHRGISPGGETFQQRKNVLHFLRSTLLRTISCSKPLRTNVKLCSYCVGLILKNLSIRTVFRTNEWSYFLRSAVVSNFFDLWEKFKIVTFTVFNFLRRLRLKLETFEIWTSVIWKI